MVECNYFFMEPISCNIAANVTCMREIIKKPGLESAGRLDTRRRQRIFPDPDTFYVKYMDD